MHSVDISDFKVKRVHVCACVRKGEGVPRHRSALSQGHMRLTANVTPLEVQFQGSAKDYQ